MNFCILTVSLAWRVAKNMPRVRAMRGVYGEASSHRSFRVWGQRYQSPEARGLRTEPPALGDFAIFFEKFKYVGVKKFLNKVLYKLLAISLARGVVRNLQHREGGRAPNRRRQGVAFRDFTFFLQNWH